MPRASPFGLLLHRYRLAARLSQEALAERARMSVEGISALERGTRRSPRFDTIALLVTALSLEGEQRRTFEAAARPEQPRSQAGGSAMGSAALDTAQSPPNNLPLSLSRFIGRETELKNILALVREQRLVTLTGAGGIGKTRAALQAGTALDAPADGVWFVELAPVSDPSLVAAVIASALGVRAVPDSPLLETLLAFFRAKTLLLILDNCEHVIGETAIVAGALLRGCPGLRILATCREPLQIAGEYIYRLPSLDAPPPDTVPKLRAADAARYAALELFADRAQAVDHRFALTDENAPIVAEICHRLDGIPLAIELAAARVSILPVKALSQRLDQRFALLTGGSRTALPRQQTLRALIDWSYALLNERERRCFLALAVFAGRFSLEAAMYVCAEPDEAEWTVFEIIASLTNKSLLMQEPDGEAFRQLETTRYYAAEKLRDSGSEDEFARRHAEYYLSITKSASASLGTTSGGAWLAEVRTALDNVRAALQWSIDQKHDVGAGLALTASFCDAWMALGQDFECRERIDTALSMCDERTPLSQRARLLLGRAQIGIRSQRSAIAPAQEAVELYRSTDDERGLATALNVLGYALSREGRCAEADLLFEEVLVIAARIDNSRQRGLALLNLGVNRETANDFQRTRELYEAALALGVARGDDYLVGAAYLDLSVLCEVTEDPEAGFSYARRAFEAFELAGETNGSALALGNVTTNLIGLGRMEEARVAARDYVIHARTYRLDTIFIVALEKIAAIAQATGDFTASAKLLGFTAARAASLGLKRDPGNVRFTDGVLRQLHEKLSDDVTFLISEGATLSEAAAADLALRVVCPEIDEERTTREALTS